MRYLGVDYGRQRIGLALSDVGGRIAFPHSVIYARGNTFVFDQIMSVIKREKVEAIVAGIPLGHDGSETEESAHVRSFVQKLGAKTDVPIEFENEMFSSRMVEDAGVAQEHVDEASAALVLQSYLDKKNR